MTALDSCEPQIIRALEKEGWRIDLKPYPITTEARGVFADFSVQRTVANQTQTIVVVEVKCFANPKADLIELYTAVGQYLYYRVNLNREGKGDLLYLALPDHVFKRFQKKPSFLDTFAASLIKLVIVDIEREVITQWQD